jgi:hypothetical protein
MLIDFGATTDLSGLLKAITYTIRVMLRPGIKTQLSSRICHDKDDVICHGNRSRQGRSRPA